MRSDRLRLEDGFKGNWTRVYETARDQAPHIEAILASLPSKEDEGATP